ncbi:MAG TPA: FtsW/RodA/SpoVE family cell cycle protein [Vicinamibacterales bacterium]|nr:FtsW/RodA/SpoVE family cell cycle protein [Vicinamibacterales bacterium]
MGVTYTTAADRQVIRRASAVRRWDRVDAAFLTLSLAIVFVVLTSAAGRLMARSTDASSSPIPVDLNSGPDAASLELALAGIHQNRADRRLAARELLAFLEGRAATPSVLPNVGALSQVRVAATTIDRTAEASAFRERLQGERDRAEAAGEDPPADLALLTPAELSALKPGFVVRSREAFIRALVVWLASYVAVFHLALVFWKVRGVRGDRVLLGAAHVLTGLGFAAMVSRPDPFRDLLLFPRYTQGVLIGVALAALVASLRLRALMSQLIYLPLALAVGLSLALIGFGDGPTGSQARVNLGPVQPIEAIRLLLALFLAGYFARRWELLRFARSRVMAGVPGFASVSLPRAVYVIPLLAGVAGAVALFFVQRDLGPALILAVVFLAAYAVARGTIGMAIAGAVLVAAGFYVGYELNLSATLVDRVRMWQAPWDNLARGGDQVAQGLWALAAGGPLGTGLGLGDTRYLPAGHTDLVLAGIGEELGAIGLLIVAGVYAAVVWRALATAIRASSEYDFFLALVLSLSVAVPVFLMAAGLLGLVPLTGVVTPYLSFGGSAMVVNFVALGLLSGIRADAARAATQRAFARPVQVLGGGMAVAALALLAVAARVQVLDADRVLVKPHLGVQADGTRRFQYNPRVLDVVQRLPRGTILDRRGLPLASDEEARLAKAAGEYASMGISLAEQCGDAGQRCYPLGGFAYHVLGDARTRLNWSASNTAFVERDAESHLRGFDDHATTVRVASAGGAEVPALRRDYRALAPLVRYRNRPGHPAVAAFLGRSRDVRLTVDARLQVRVSEILAAYAARSSSGRAAAVVLDVETGDILASVSHPWPSEAPPAGRPAADELLDRARFGLYPPGSTFKLLTAAAALRSDPAARNMRFTCSRLPDGRVGARLAGWRRPVRDDILDRHPHGTLEMGRALTVSCNAYFAQLAVRLGPGPLIEAASLAGLSLARRNAPERVAATLPQVGYGQADVLATPMQMARLAAAIASGGSLREPRIVRDAPLEPASKLLAPESARLLAGFMRDVVREGSGRSLRDREVAMAGKTGTAEVAGARSHAWFVGFAPAGRATPRIALAVLVEHGGYGGASAAPAAGEIVDAAAASGLIE